MQVTTLGYALLGLLAREALSGYDLAQRLRGRVGFFWSARHSQIYPELARLEGAGLVRHEVVPQADRPDKKVYTITEAGLAALRAWVVAPVAPAAPRDELVLKAYSLWLGDPAEAAALLREQERLHREHQTGYEARLARLEATFGAALREPGGPPFATFLALSRGIGYEREYADWCGWAADLLAGVGR